MSDLHTAVSELSAALSEIDMPRDFTDRFDLLECFAHSHATETFLVMQKGTQNLCVAKLYDRGVYKTVSESRILESLHHDGLPAFIGEYSNDKSVCIVREYIEGTPLDKYLVREKPTREQMVGITEELCDILSYLHGLEPPVIHRDIKPQNIIVRDDGSVCLIDFDAARRYIQDAQTDTQLIGTRIYAPPEQYGFSQTDCRADIYSLGVLLCFMLTGDTDTKRTVINDRRLAAVVRRCTAFSPEERFPNAAAVKKALLDDNVRKRPALLRILVSVALCLFALCAGFIVGRWTDFMSPHPEEPASQFVEPLMEQAVRVQLGKSEGEIITDDELLAVREIYIFGEECAVTDETFSEGLSGERCDMPRGTLATLDDVRLLPNLEILYINHQTLADISAVALLDNLQYINLRHTFVEDITALSGMRHLRSVILFDTRVSDAASLDSCPELNTLDVGVTLITSLDALPVCPTLESMSLAKLPLLSISGIERFERLRYLSLRNTGLSNLSPLYALPNLETVSVDETMREAVEALGDTVFEVCYE